MSDLKPTRQEVDLSITDPVIHRATRCALYAALAFSRSDGSTFAQGELLSDLAKLFSDFQRERNLQVERLQTEVFRLRQFSTEPKSIDRLIAEQGARPIESISEFSGIWPDEPTTESDPATPGRKV